MKSRIFIDIICCIHTIWLCFWSSYMNNQRKCQLGDCNEDTTICIWLNVSKGIQELPQKLHVHISPESPWFTYSFPVFSPGLLFQSVFWCILSSWCLSGGPFATCSFSCALWVPCQGLRGDSLCWFLECVTNPSSSDLEDFSHTGVDKGLCILDGGIG